MKKFVAILLTLVFTLSLASALADTIVIAVPNDATNEGRALLLLQSNGVLTLKEDAGLKPTKDDIESTTVDIELYEADADFLPTVLPDVDYAIINNNYALDADLDPVNGSLLIEDADSPYVNVVSVKEGNEDTDLAKALAAALTSQTVVDYINDTYGGSAIATVTEPTDGYDPTVDYDALKGTTFTVVATPVPHAEVLELAAKILAEKDITLEIRVVTNYTAPNDAVESGDAFANYFAHQPYQDDYNEENNTHLVTIAGIHVEPMALYGGRQSDLTALGITD